MARVVMGAQAWQWCLRVIASLQHSHDGDFQSLFAANVEDAEELGGTVVEHKIDIPEETFWRASEYPLRRQATVVEVGEQRVAQTMGWQFVTACGVTEEALRQVQAGVLTHGGADVKVVAAFDLHGLSMLETADPEACQHIEAHVQHVGAGPVHGSMHAVDVALTEIAGREHFRKVSKRERGKRGRRVTTVSQIAGRGRRRTHNCSRRMLDQICWRDADRAGERAVGGDHA